MIRRLFAVILLSLLAALSAVEAAPRFKRLERVHRPSLPVEQVPNPDAYGGYGGAPRRAQGGGGRQVIPPSAALDRALGYSPGSQGLGVRLLKDGRLMYAVKLKTGNKVHRVLIDAETGQVVGE